MNQSSDVSISIDSQIGDDGVLQRSQAQTKTRSHRLFRGVRSFAGPFVIDNSSIFYYLSVQFAQSAIENSTNPDFKPFVESERGNGYSDDNVIRIPVVSRRRVKIGKVTRLKPLKSE